MTVAGLYNQFLDAKTQQGADSGFEPLWLPDSLFPFQRNLVEWAIRKGRAGVFADCGLGKTLLQLCWAENVARKTGKRVLVLTPLAVAHQTVMEGQKFGIECSQSRDGKMPSQITVTNYQKLHHFSSDDLAGVVCDESGILKNFDGAIKAQVTDFMRKVPYRSLWTATAAPNDYIELGTSSEALGELGFQDMLSKFFKKKQATSTRSDEYRAGVWAFRGHAERDFWRWVCSWARAVRKPSDLGFEDGDFALPELRTVEHVVSARTRRAGWLFDMPAMDLHEQREERRRTIVERCEMVAELLQHDRPAVAWCHLNDEGKLLEKLIPDAVEVDGHDSDDFKEETYLAFAKGEISKVISKPILSGYGLNWQHCAHETFFPSHSFEQWYQAIRRCWRFGQKNPVRVDMVTSEGERGVLQNLNRKAAAAAEMSAQLVALMNEGLNVRRIDKLKKGTVPGWL